MTTMFRPRLGSLCLAGAMFVLLASPAQAQRTVTFPPLKLRRRRRPRRLPGPRRPARRLISSSIRARPCARPSTARRRRRRTSPSSTRSNTARTSSTSTPTASCRNSSNGRAIPPTAANLVKFTNEQLGDGNNYQYATKPLASPGFDPVDIPILYMAGDYDFTLKPAEVDNLQQIHHRRAARSSSTPPAAGTSFPGPWSARCARSSRRNRSCGCPLDHPVFNVRFRIKEVSMEIKGVQDHPAAGDLQHRHRHPGGGHPGAGRARCRPCPAPNITRPAGTSSASRPSGSASTSSPTCWAAPNMADSWPRISRCTRASTRPGDVIRFAAVRYSGSWDLNPAVQNSLFWPASRTTPASTSTSTRIR